MQISREKSVGLFKKKHMAPEWHCCARISFTSKSSVSWAMIYDLPFEHVSIFLNKNIQIRLCCENRFRTGRSRRLNDFATLHNRLRAGFY
jgi:hypothetical protein